MILVSGGAGYIGSHTCVELIEAGYEVVVADNLINSCEEAVHRVEKIVGKKVPFVKCELCDPAEVKELFNNYPDIDSVIHFAGLKAVGESAEMPLWYYRTNVAGTLNLLDAMEAHGCRSLVFSSSATVYGAPEEMPLTEKQSMDAQNPYGRTKEHIEDMLVDLAASDPSWNVALLRYFNPVGAHESGRIGEDPTGVPNNLLPFIAQVAVGRREKLRVFGADYPTADGTGVRDYIHVVDLADGHLRALDHITEHGGVRTWNLGTGKGYSVLDMLHAFERACGRELPYELTGRRLGDVASCYADPALAADELGWQAGLGLEEMCADAWRWQFANPEGYR